ncbi:MAG TPA: ISAs1 family transposase [Methylosinus sp.]
MQALITIFRQVRDPRDINARHDCASMLFIALMATLCGAKNCVDIADFAAANERHLAEIVDLPHGAPSHDSFSRLFRLLDPEEMSKAFAAFAKALREALGLGPAKGVVAIDGKRLRRGYERGRAFMPPLMISVFDAETRLSIAARASADGNEVKATLEALKSLDLKGCVVTADALHCHPKMAEGVRARGGHYALKLKANNGPLHKLAVAAFEKADARGGGAFHETSSSGHDRSERRRGEIVAAPKDANFPGLAAFGRIVSERRKTGGETSTAVHYIALSKRLAPARLIEVVRGHWSVENNLHHLLDVVFFEDDARSRKDHAPQNLSSIRRMALDMLNAHPDKRSIARKMKLALWSKEFFFELFTHMR